MLRVWGCRAYHTVTYERAKLDNEATPLVFVRHEDDTAAYRLYDPVTRRIIRSRNARFVEDEVPFAAAAPRSTAASPIVPAQEDLIILATSQNPLPAAPQAAGPQTPARAPPALSVGPVRAAQICNFTVTPPPQPVFVRENAPSPPAPVAPLSPSPASLSVKVDISQDEIDFLGNDPFGATLAKVEALCSAASDDLSASEEPKSESRMASRYVNFRCQHQILKITYREAMRNLDSARWRNGEQD
ncbi:hypothetical protein JCM10908_002491 [Rhodotorula pacifica]|uniref:uncharacterized protein n=1 Tax=Rhodotorula pacifica TaxID=1495444 RepID=UPI00317BBB25